MKAKPTRFLKRFAVFAVLLGALIPIAKANGPIGINAPTITGSGTVNGAGSSLNAANGGEIAVNGAAPSVSEMRA
jgi:hypothetical protein